jgi:trans-aconitate methyltransferase
MNTWDSETYNQKFHYVSDYGKALFDLIDFKQVETAIDLGCGTGILTNALASQHINVVGLDASSSQIAKARESYPKLMFIQKDASSFRVNHPVDLIFSNALFHWIPESVQEKMMKCIGEALKSGGQLVFECGGYGNNVMIHHALEQVFKKHGYTYSMPFYFPTIGDYAPMIEKAGMIVQYAKLFKRPTPLSGEDGLSDWIRMFVTKPFIGIDQQEKNQMIEECVESLRKDMYHHGTWYADYVRLRMKAIKKVK